MGEIILMKVSLLTQYCWDFPSLKVCSCVCVSYCVTFKDISVLQSSLYSTAGGFFCKLNVSLARTPVKFKPLGHFYDL